MSETAPVTVWGEIFANQGMHGNARFLAELHASAPDYLRQAPVLALAFGVKRNTRADRLYVAMRCGGPIERGERLRSVMAAVGLAYPLRKLAGRILTPGDQPIIRALNALPASVLSQAIPQTSGEQRTWLRALRLHRHRADLRSHRITADEFQWFASHAGQAQEAAEAESILDYIATCGAFDWSRWSWERARIETELWHDRLASERDLQRLPGLVQMETQIDISDWPEHAEVAGFEFFKLATPGMIMEEGRRMRHCVGSYIPDVLNGAFSLFSIRKDMRRVATMQLKGRKVVQLSGFANKVAPKGCAKAAVEFIGSDAP